MNEKGTATLVCGWCDRETQAIAGTLGEEETDEGRMFYPEKPFRCPECKSDDFTWLEFWDEN